MSPGRAGAGIVIRPLRPADLEPLRQAHNAALPAARLTPAGFRHRLQSGRVWVLLEAGRPLAYARARPVPGLPHLANLQGCVAPAEQRRGLGSRLLGQILADLRGGPISLLTHAVASLEGASAAFLLAHGFTVEHEERSLVRDQLDRLPPAELPAGYALRSLGRAAAAALFRQLYAQSFGGLAWHQAYLSDAEVAAELSDPADLLFLYHGPAPAGFAWLRWAETAEAQIEPIGLIPAYQGRGLGRALLLAALAELRAQGAERVRLGAWSDNQRALRLYAALGFRPEGSLTYLGRRT
ncbi:MAG: GNAT family N-acetyltransferase [Candidatus Promineifilaceae bacterium]